jgi:signal peptidase
VTRSRAWRVLVRVVDVIVLTLIVVGAFYLWPARFGGSTTFVIVGGHSMDPTYSIGDIVVIRAGDPKVGDVVAFDPPIDNPGRPLVIHRIVGGDPDGWVTQGDGNEFTDPWEPPSSDVVGIATFRIPLVGRLIPLLATPTFYAAILGLATITLLWPRAKAPPDDDAEPPGDGDGPPGPPDEGTGGAGRPVGPELASVQVRASGL